jgi:hypothetical protein
MSRCSQRCASSPLTTQRPLPFHSRPTTLSIDDLKIFDALYSYLRHGKPPALYIDCGIT